MDAVLSKSNFNRQDVLAPIATGISIAFVILYILYTFFRYTLLYDNEYWVDDYQPDRPEASEFDVTDTDRRRGNRLFEVHDDQSGSDSRELRYLTAGLFAIFSCALLIFFANSIITQIVLTGPATGLTSPWRKQKSNSTIRPASLGIEPNTDLKTHGASELFKSLSMLGGRLRRKRKRQVNY